MTTSVKTNVVYAGGTSSTGNGLNYTLDFAL